MRSCAVRVMTKQFDLVNKLRERIAELENRELRLQSEVIRMTGHADDWKTRAAYAVRMLEIERQLRRGFEHRALKAEGLLESQLKVGSD